MTFSDAVKFITTEINKDSSMQLCYIANIAYEFESEYNQYCKENNYRPLNRADVHTISKRAAKRFMYMWLLNADKEK